MQRCSFSSLPRGVHSVSKKAKKDAGHISSVNHGRCSDCSRLSYGYYCEYKKQPAGCGLEKRRRCIGFAMKREEAV